MTRLYSIEKDFDRIVKMDLFSRFTYSLNPFLMKEIKGENVFFNILAFAPFAFLASASSSKTSFLKILGISFLLSLGFEAFQIFTAWGGFATMDLICNTLGGAVGFILFVIFDWIRKQCFQEARDKMTMAVVVICYVFFLPLAVYGVVKKIYHIDFYLSIIEPMINSLR